MAKGVDAVNSCEGMQKRGRGRGGRQRKANGAELRTGGGQSSDGLEARKEEKGNKRRDVGDEERLGSVVRLKIRV